MHSHAHTHTHTHTHTHKRAYAHYHSQIRECTPCTSWHPQPAKTCTCTCAHSHKQTHLYTINRATTSTEVGHMHALSCIWTNTFVGWLLNVPATCQCISGTDLLRQFYVLPHWYTSCRSNFPSRPVTVYWHRANQSQHWPYNARRLAG